MSCKAILSENAVREFLNELKELLTAPNFDVSRDLDILLKKSNELPTNPFTTGNTLLALDFDRNDILEQLMNLDISDYLETFIDDKDSDLPPFFAFGRVIKSRDVYIKVKIRDRMKNKVFCISFHFARYPLPIKRPYA